MRIRHPGRLAAAIGVAFVIVAAIAWTGAESPIFTANEPTAVPQPTLAYVTPPTTTTVTMASRPRTLPLAGLNPCKILTAQQRSALSLDTTPTEYTDTEFAQAKACTMRGLNSGTVARIALVTSMGVDVWLDSEAQVTATPVVVDAFPALVVRTPGLDDACNVEVDTGDNQFMDILFRDGGNVPPIPQDELCQGAQQVAAAAVTSLQQID